MLWPLTTLSLILNIEFLKWTGRDLILLSLDTFTDHFSIFRLFSANTTCHRRKSKYCKSRNIAIQYCSTHLLYFSEAEQQQSIWAGIELGHHNISRNNTNQAEIFSSRHNGKELYQAVAGWKGAGGLQDGSKQGDTRHLPTHNLIVSNNMFFRFNHVLCNNTLS